MMKHLLLLCSTLSIAVISTGNPSPLRALDVSGSIRITGESVELYTPAYDVTPKLKLITKRKGGTRAVVEAKGSLADRSLYLEDAYFSHRFNKRWQLRAGWSKKHLGHEFSYNRRDRLTIGRSIICQKLQTLGMVGRQLNTTVVWDPFKSKKKLRLEAGAGTNGSRDYTGTVSTVWHHRQFGSGVWLMGEAHRIDNGYLFIYGEALAMWYKTASGRIELELVHGVDAHQTEYAKTFSTPRTVHFSGPRLDVSVNIRKGSILWTPFFQGALLFEDVTHPKESEIQLMLGLNLTVKKIVLSINSVAVGKKESVPPRQRKLEPSFYVAATYWF